MQCVSTCGVLRVFMHLYVDCAVLSHRKDGRYLIEIFGLAGERGRERKKRVREKES